MLRERTGIILAVFLISCTMSPQGPGSTTPGGTTPGNGNPATVTPQRLLRECSRALRMPRACPRQIPVGQSYSSTGMNRSGNGSFRTWDLTGASSRQAQDPSLLHLVVEVGDLRLATETLHWNVEHPIDLTEGLLESSRRTRFAERRMPTALYFGTRHWGAASGQLLLVPPIEYTGSIHSDHLVFLWQEGKISALYSIHSWEPLPQAEATLRRIVVSSDWI